MSVRNLLSAAAFALVAAAPLHAQAFDNDGLERFDAALDDRAERGVRAGYAAILIRDGETHVSTAGYRDIASGAEMTADTLVRIASMSKPISAVAAMMLVEDGVLSLDTPVADFLPRFGDVGVVTSFEPDADGNFPTEPQATPMTVRHLLTHTAGVGYIFDGSTALGALYAERTLYAGDGDLSTKMDELAELPLYFQPGSRWFYSYSNDILGAVVEAASGMPYEDFLDNRIFDPLGMDSTTFFVADEALDRVATVYVHGEDGNLYPAFSDENPEYRPSWASGGGGLISTANDYARFAQMLANGGVFGEIRLLESETLQTMISPQVTPEQLPDGMAGLTYGLGFGIVLPAAEGETAMGIPGDYGWGGFFDTDFFVSPASGLVAVMMTQELPTENMPGGRTGSWWRASAYGTLPQ